MKLPAGSLLFIIAISGCQVGPRIDEFEQARRPQGATTSIKLYYGFVPGSELEGELLEVRERGLLLNVPETRKGDVIRRRLVFVPYTAMIDIEIDELGRKVLSEGDTKKRQVRQREQLRLLSRFPQGLSAPLLEQLLAAEGQKTVYVIDSE